MNQRSPSSRVWLRGNAYEICPYAVFAVSLIAANTCPGSWPSAAPTCVEFDHYTQAALVGLFHLRRIGHRRMAVPIMVINSLEKIG
jgi:hypothetical protein